MFRTAVRDTEVNGQPIAEGERVALLYPAANRDPAAFDDPDRFDVTNAPAMHLAFGHGTHFCLGANLARLEMRLLLEELTAAHHAAATGVRTRHRTERLRPCRPPFRPRVRSPLTRPRGRPHKSDDPATRDRLLEAAAAACVEVGFDAVTLANVATRAGVTPAAVYNHFTDKDELLYTAGRLAIDRLNASMAPAGDTAEAAHAVVEEFLRPSFRPTRRLILELHLAGARHPELAERLAVWHGEFAALADRAFARRRRELRRCRSRRCSSSCSGAAISKISTRSGPLLPSSASRSVGSSTRCTGMLRNDAPTSVQIRALID